MLGCVVDSSVAPFNGEQPWLIAPQYKLSFPLSIMMNFFPYETFLTDVVESGNGVVFAASIWQVGYWLFKTTISFHISAYSWVH